MTGSDHEEGGRGDRRPTPEREDQPTDPLEEPVASRATLARRLRAVERALAGTEGAELERGSDAGNPRTTDEWIGPMDERLDTVEDRTEALRRAVRALGEFLVTRDRARRTNDGIESIQRAMETLPDAADGTGGTGGADGTDGTAGNDRIGTHDPDPGTADTGGRDVAPGIPDSETVLDGAGAAGDESTTEWLDRVASGGVTPPRVE